MTNREWINSLTDEEFASWICDGESFYPRTMVYEQPSPKWDTLKYGYTDAKGGLLIWLKQERKK